MKEVYIVSAGRTPIGSLSGVFDSLTAIDLGSTAVNAAVERAGIQHDQVQELIVGNVITANVGQAPAKQTAMAAGLPKSVPCTAINKVCASGMKSIMYGAQTIMTGDNDIVVAGGMESMTNTPYYIPKARSGYKLGHAEILDGILRDGLIDPYKGHHMGNAAEICADGCNIPRDAQDDYAVQSYERAAEAYKNGSFKDELVPVEVPQRKGDPVVVDEDEEYKNMKMDKLKKLKPVFQKEGTVTAANSSKINDGAAAVTLMSKEKAEELGVTPIAKIRSYADASQDPDWFTTTPSKAMPKAAKKAGLELTDMDYYEINEAFSVVALANIQEMGLDPSRVNIYGGAVALGHPIGCSGARILVTLLSALRNNDGKVGCAGICNGGGGASSMVVERL